jgi:hypothetical protein
MTLLDRRVPITLICDLVSSSDPDSATINSVERPTDDMIWLEAANQPASATARRTAC